MKQIFKEKIKIEERLHHNYSPDVQLFDYDKDPYEQFENNNDNDNKYY